MRSKPVSRDEVRFDPWRHITTLPIDSVYLDAQDNLKPIRKLWTPLVRQLNRTKEKSGKPVEYPQHVQRLYSRGVPECRHCDRKFYRTGYYGFYCSDRCESLTNAPRRAARIAAFVNARSKERADNRETNCDHCGKPIEAKRSTMRFCSVKCRVAAHRELDKMAKRGRS